CLEPFSYFSMGTGGSIPAGTTLYGIGDIAFHNPGGTILVQLNNTSVNFRIELVATSTALISFQGSNSPGQMNAAYIPCSLGIDDLQNSNGVLSNFPNPLTEKTKFIYTLKSSGKVSLKVFNTIGQIVKTIVRDEFQGPNIYSYDWSGDNDMGRKLYNGIYYYTLTVNDKTVQTNKLIISR
ncbi:MAG: T9SS type A sorting domain-containing protein, partial [Bacteroidia bacterium]